MFVFAFSKQNMRSNKQKNLLSKFAAILKQFVIKSECYSNNNAMFIRKHDCYFLSDATRHTSMNLRKSHNTKVRFQVAL